MKIVRVRQAGYISYGILEGEIVNLLSGLPWEAHTDAGTVNLSDCTLLAPVEPTKVVAVGINYKSHAAEMEHELPEDPVIFIKPATAVIGPMEPIRIPAMSQRVDYEAELGVVIGRKIKSIDEADAMDAVLGFTCLNDVTARDLQKKDGQWTRGKGFDTFCPIGPWIETELKYNDVEVTSRLNDEIKQQSRTSLLINSIPRVISYISQVMTLNPGDVIATGTPAGIGPMQDGDIVEIEVEGIGILRNPVIIGI